MSRPQKKQEFQSFEFNESFTLGLSASSTKSYSVGTGWSYGVASFSNQDLAPNASSTPLTGPGSVLNAGNKRTGALIWFTSSASAGWGHSETWKSINFPGKFGMSFNLWYYNVIFRYQVAHFYSSDSKVSGNFLDPIQSPAVIPVAGITSIVYNSPNIDVTYKNNSSSRVATINVNIMVKMYQYDVS